MTLALALLALAALDPPVALEPPPLTASQKEAIVAARKAAEVKAAPVALRFAAAVRAVTDNMLADAPDPAKRQRLADEMRAALGEVMLAKGQQTWDTCQLLTVEQRRWVRAAMAKPGAPGDPWEVIEKAFKFEGK